MIHNIFCQPKGVWEEAARRADATETLAGDSPPPGAHARHVAWPRWRSQAPAADSGHRAYRLVHCGVWNYSCVRHQKLLSLRMLHIGVKYDVMPRHDWCHFLWYFTQEIGKSPRYHHMHSIYKAIYNTLQLVILIDIMKAIDTTRGSNLLCALMQKVVCILCCIEVGT